MPGELAADPREARTAPGQDTTPVGTATNEPATTEPATEAKSTTEPAHGDKGPEGGNTTDKDTEGKGTGIRATTARVKTALAGLLVLGVLLAPKEIAQLTPVAFARIPVEGLAGLALLLVLPGRIRRVAAVLLGFLLGLLTLVKVVDLGFLAVLARPFDPVFDWVLFDDAVGFLTDSLGRAGAIITVAAALLLAAALLVFLPLSVLRLAQAAARRRAWVARAVAVLAVAWVACAMLEARFGPGLPLAARDMATLAYDRALAVSSAMRDREIFAESAVTDAFRDTPAERLLTALRGKDVVVTFVESYGRDAVEDPEFAPQVSAVLDGGTRRLAEAGFASRSAFLTSPTAGGSSWLAHATFLSGLWIDNQQRYHDLVSSDRFTLTRAFHRASWRTVGVMPGVTQAWPEGAFHGFDRIYDAANLGYRGPNFSWATMPDQYTLSAFQRFERVAGDRPPVMAVIPLVSSHAPWSPLPRLMDWAEVGDGSVFQSMAAPGELPEVILTRDPTRVRTEYRKAIEYSLSSLISYVENHGDDNLVLIFLGDHQPAPVVTGEGASRDVPITIISRDPAVLDQIAGWGWQEGLKPGPRAPVWRMDAFRDRFLTAFSPPLS